MKVYYGLIQKYPTEVQFEQYRNNDLNLAELSLEDTIQVCEINGKEIEYIDIKVCYKEIDKHGQEKYIYNMEKNEYEIIYENSPIFRAYGKEKRIILELGVNAPVKIVVDEKKKELKTIYTVVCVQNQKVGKLIDL